MAYYTTTLATAAYATPATSATTSPAASTLSVSTTTSTTPTTSSMDTTIVPIKRRNILERATRRVRRWGMESKDSDGLYWDAEEAQEASRLSWDTV